MNFFKIYAYVLLLTAVAVCKDAACQGRLKQSINTNWGFYKGDIENFPQQQNAGVKWEPISIPHTWNKYDVDDDKPGYYRGAGWYKKTLEIPFSWKNKSVSLYFEGANQEVSVYVNGKFAGGHIGGYTAFNISISRFLNFDGPGNTENILTVKVTNAHNEDIPPLTADFTFYGGIYRDVYLLATNLVHFDTDDLASNGVFITTPSVSEASATVSLKGRVQNNSPEKQTIKAITQIYNKRHELVAKSERKLSIGPNQNLTFGQLFKSIARPDLWSPDHPDLYNVVSTLIDTKSNKILDEISNPLGFRWFSFDSNTGFYLNGKPLKLIGASRHQDFKCLGNALPDAIHVHDIELLKALGGNLIRIAHYPQDPAVVEACDRLGILASEEIPVVNQITESTAFYDNCKHMQLEMIRQNYNHPSIVIWAYMNEILLRPQFQNDPQKQNKYFGSIANLAKQIETLTRSEDPSRYTMIPCHENYDLYNRVGLLQIPKIVGWNLYNGWYSANLDGFAAFIDKFHLEKPNTPFIISEYGADADPRIHSTNPERFDKSLEYAVIYHQVYLKAIEKRPFVAGAAIWNLADFNSEQRGETMPHINNKGITTTDRKLKDTYLYYQANLLKTPFIKIGSRRWTLRSGIADANGKLTCTQPLEVYTNLLEVSLFVNGKMLAKKTAQDHVCKFDVPFVNGTNRIEAVAQGYNDATDVEFLLVPADLKSTKLPFTELNVSVGDRRIFVDDEKHLVWLPEKEYQPGSWGYVGGSVYVMKGNSRQSFGSDKNIMLTSDDPVYQTQRVGIKAFNFDVPDGVYEVTLHFAELESPEKKEGLAYNLDSQHANQQTFLNRSFNVSINGLEVVHELSNTGALQPLTAYATKSRIIVKDGKGIKVDFYAIKGVSILNGIQLRKIM